DRAGPRCERGRAGGRAASVRAGGPDAVVAPGRRGGGLVGRPRTIPGAAGPLAVASAPNRSATSWRTPPASQPAPPLTSVADSCYSVHHAEHQFTAANTGQVGWACARHPGRASARVARAELHRAAAPSRGAEE